MNFDEADVWAVARAIGSGVYVDESGRNAYLRCEHCKNREYFSWNEPHGKQYNDFVHATNCVTLIARDLLTGSK